jgi:hypothetical protein
MKRMPVVKEISVEDKPAIDVQPCWKYCPLPSCPPTHFTDLPQTEVEKWSDRSPICTHLNIIFLAHTFRTRHFLKKVKTHSQNLGRVFSLHKLLWFESDVFFLSI